MSMGIPAIVTGWSGTADFVDSSVGYLINYTLSKVGSLLPVPFTPTRSHLWFKYMDSTAWFNVPHIPRRSPRVSPGGSREPSGPMQMCCTWGGWVMRKFNCELDEFYNTDKTSHMYPYIWQLMRHVYENPREAAAKGAAARELMLSQYSPDVVGHLVAAEVRRIKESIRCESLIIVVLPYAWWPVLSI